VSEAREPIVSRPPEGRTLGIVGDVYRFLATGADTAGKYAQFEALVPPGGGPPPHVHHREEESFYVLEGLITFFRGSETVQLGPGGFAAMPVSVPHAFRNETDRPARMLITLAPAGLEEMFFELGQPLSPGDTSALPPSHDDLARLLAAAPRYGVEILPPPHA